MLAAQYLTSLKLQHSKSEYLTHSEHMQSYLQNESLKIQDKKLLFKLRNRLIDVKLNFKKKYKEDMTCRLCFEGEESQSHLLECSVILSDVNIKNELEGFAYTDTFSTNQDTQTHMILIWQKIMRMRASKLRINPNEDSSS